MGSEYEGLLAQDGRLDWCSVKRQKLAATEVRIKVHAAGVNRADLSQRAGRYPPPEGVTAILGLECSGEVVETGAAVTQWSVGQKVCALLPGGGMATEVVADEQLLLTIPENVSMTEAAGLPEVFATAWLNLFRLAELKPGESVLLMAGASGVGTAAIQLCRQFGNPVSVVVGSKSKLEYCLELGAVGGINRHKDDWQQLKASGPFDVILDPVGGDWLEKLMILMGNGGRLVNIAFMAGRYGRMDFAQLMMKKLKLLGSTLRSRPLAEKGMIIGDLQQKVWPEIAAGGIRPIIDSVYAIKDAEKAFEKLASDSTTGKVILTLP